MDAIRTIGRITAICEAIINNRNALAGQQLQGRSVWAIRLDWKRALAFLDAQFVQGPADFRLGVRLAANPNFKVLGADLYLTFVVIIGYASGHNRKHRRANLDGSSVYLFICWQAHC